jgi:hypothetical protein
MAGCAGMTVLVHVLPIELVVSRQNPQFDITLEPEMQIILVGETIRLAQLLG